MTLLSLFHNSNVQKKNVLIFGEDAVLNDYLATSYIKESQFKDMEKVVIDCDSDGLDELIATLTEASLFSSQKLVMVKNPFFLTAKMPAKFKKQSLQLQTIFENLDQLDDILILVASYDKLDKRKKLTKIVQRNLNVIETSFKPYEVSGIIKSIINQEGYQISKSALQLLLERSDQVMDTALSGYNKLKISSNNRQISEQDVAQNIDLSLAQNVFAIIESAIKQNYNDAMARLQDQLREGISPIQLIAVFENQIETLLCVKVLSERKRSESQIVKELKIHPYRVKLALKSKINSKKLKQLLLNLIDLDYGYKNGTYHDDNMLKLFILNC